MMTSPIVLFVYNRPAHTRRTVEALQRNPLAASSELTIYSDGAKNDAAKPKVAEVRDYIKTISGFKNITIIERDRNWGLANSIIDGVTALVNQQGKVIVLEDDLVTSPHFLTYMNDALDFYAEQDRVASIHGYSYPVKATLPETFFLRGADCWGWATWKRAWDIFEPDGRILREELKRRKLKKTFDFNGAYPYFRILNDQIRGRNNSWAVRWHASAFLADKLTLYPGRSLIHNIGTDDSGEHCRLATNLDATLSKTHIDLKGTPIEPSMIGAQAYEVFLRESFGIRQRLRLKLQARFRRIAG